MHLLYEQARTLLDTVEFAALSKVDDATLFGIDLSANQLHAALLNDDSGTEFVRLVSTKFQVLTKLIGPLNTLFP
jgi:hypothetical protein